MLVAAIPGVLIHVYRTEQQPRVVAFASEIGSGWLPAPIGAWHRADGHAVEGVVGLPDFIRNAVAEKGYVLMFIERDLITPRWDRANDG
jgi:hypothetical protein